MELVRRKQRLAAGHYASCCSLTVPFLVDGLSALWSTEPYPHTLYPGYNLPGQDQNMASIYYQSDTIWDVTDAPDSNPIFQNNPLDYPSQLHEALCVRLDDIISQIDAESYDRDAGLLQLSRDPRSRRLPKCRKTKKGDQAAQTAGYFQKAALYTNSRLPPKLPIFKLFPLLCIAARASRDVYDKPKKQGLGTHIKPDHRVGNKAMVVKMVTIEDKDLVVFAIRGSQGLLDWTVNLSCAPTSPAGFLDDPGNLCHAGFLSVARRTVEVIAAQLRRLLIAHAKKDQFSLLITGHSAGGAVAALLYAHMLSTTPDTRSELNLLTAYFKRIHCITFGAPPVSLLPLTKPPTEELRTSMFLSFVNEGDPVVRADRAYVKSLINLYAHPAPARPKFDKLTSLAKSKTTTELHTAGSGSLWNVPQCAFSNAGRVIVLRTPQILGQGPSSDRAYAQVVSDQQLRSVIWGDPHCHTMRLYQERVEMLATNAVTGRE